MDKSLNEEHYVDDVMITDEQYLTLTSQGQVLVTVACNHDLGGPVQKCERNVNYIW